MRLWIITKTSAQETKQTNKQSSLLILTVPCEKRSKKKQIKWNKARKNSKKVKKGTKKLIKLIMKAMIVMISWDYNKIKIKNNGKSEHVEK